MNQDQVHELLYQMLETELGGVEVYRTAVRCAVNEDLAGQWTTYLGQTEHHVEVLRGLFGSMGLDPEVDLPGREGVRTIGRALVAAMEAALDADRPELAQLVAAECVTLAETKDHLNWELLGEVAKGSPGEQAKLLHLACSEVENDEDDHLYHSAGWARELWLDSLGLPAVLPPPEEQRQVESMLEAAEAKEARAEMV